MASEVKHTPGPWAFEDPMGRDVGLWIVQGGLPTYEWSCIAMVTADDAETRKDGRKRHITFVEQQANARLIAAAPELLEALRTLCAPDASYHDGEIRIRLADHGSALKAMRMAREAVAEAEFRS